MGILTKTGAQCFVDGRELTAGTAIRRHDEADGKWYEGEVAIASSYDHSQQKYTPFLTLKVEGYAPSPLRDGDLIEVIQP